MSPLQHGLSSEMQIIAQDERTSCCARSTLPRDGTFDFLRLPPELRNSIYRYCLGGTTWIIGLRSGSGPAENENIRSLALLGVCHQIYAEASLFPFMFNTFQGWHNGHLREWALKLQPRQRRAVRSIKSIQRGYIVNGTQGMDVSPSFWIGIPDVRGWGLHALQMIELEVVLFSWRHDSREGEVDEARCRTFDKLCKMIQDRHPGIKLVTKLRKNSH